MRKIKHRKGEIKNYPKVLVYRKRALRKKLKKIYVLLKGGWGESPFLERNEKKFRLESCGSILSRKVIFLGR